MAETALGVKKTTGARDVNFTAILMQYQTVHTSDATGTVSVLFWTWTKILKEWSVRVTVRL